jgi:phosphatidylinositol alpha-1,6-mannosyltransferase
VLAHRVVAGLRRFEPVVLAPAAEGAEAFDRAQPFPVVRTPAGRTKALTNVLLDRAALGVARSLQPHVVLAVHVACSPPAALLRAFRRTPWALYLHADELVDRPALTRLAVRTADRLIPVSAHTERLALSFGADAARVRRINPGVDLPGAPVAARDERPTVLTVARLVKRYKGHDVMVRALARLRGRVPGVRWVVVGDGPLRGELESLAAAEGVSDLVTFAGAVPDGERDAWLDRAHVFAMPSRLPPGAGGEGFGIVYTEASAHGLPVVAGAVGGATDAVLDGRTGLLVDPSDPAAVADALARVLLDPDLAARLGAGGRERARELAWPLVAERVEDALLELVPA